MTVDVTVHLDAVLAREHQLLTKAQLREVERKLRAKPDYGRPLQGPLAGLFRLRVGDYRVVYKLAGEQIQILAIGPRRDEEVYRTAENRLA